MEMKLKCTQKGIPRREKENYSDKHEGKRRYVLKAKTVVTEGRYGKARPRMQRVLLHTKQKLRFRKIHKKWL
jgi:hypothetical protein